MITFVKKKKGKKSHSFTFSQKKLNITLNWKPSNTDK